VSARFRTETPFSVPARPRPQPQQPKPPQPQPQPQNPEQPKVTPRPSACATTRWLTRRGSGRNARRTLPLLDLAAADVQRCLGTPAKRTRRGATERWTYRGAVTLELRLTDGRVTAFTLRRGLRSSPDRAAAGSSLQSFRKALGTVARDGRRGYRAAIAVGADRVADVRLAVSSSGKVTRVSVTLKRRSALDAAGRRLLGGRR
jgi:hypothetical protein